MIRSLLALGLLVASLYDFYYYAVGWPIVPVIGTAVVAIAASTYRAHAASRSLLGVCALGGVLACISTFWASATFDETIAPKGFVGVVYGLTMLYSVGSRRG
jgi:hypothetical protein